jgi:hypothetical protein
MDAWLIAMLPCGKRLRITNQVHSHAIVDSQSVKSAAMVSLSVGYDADTVKVPTTTWYSLWVSARLVSSRAIFSRAVVIS